MTTHSNEPFSERWRLAAMNWVELDGAARWLEDSKSSVFSQQLLLLGDVPVTRAEHQVRASVEWRAYIAKMDHARTAANEAKVERDYLYMRYWQQNSHEANMRKEISL